MQIIENRVIYFKVQAFDGVNLKIIINDAHGGSVRLYDFVENYADNARNLKPFSMAVDESVSGNEHDLSVNGVVAIECAIHSDYLPSGERIVLISGAKLTSKPIDATYLAISDSEEGGPISPLTTDLLDQMFEELAQRNRCNTFRL